ncbi:aspartyl/glutamyl-tRNA(Asn/Gln) amidotransferase subunit C [Sulfobacillus thermosulfidooxidans DSM 9293]|uniref:Aspartyl/glutamyl-tRNA(Asn/Gln) amidotransferase subunit C n=1 Tax=Sulfobacillus thermosulfidooxidans (strain DSM 9293 / VKM B-1269 / AT-1) TaxID=929705 RepID=A0A1W1WIH1_SULTA|nr:Asp-tRNA(Asn)/Glu-tRNA(Gln) amidotransferase subunit GatC [Sulfobacillus thermosulfidooxidans]SMC05523.1 aspartyl/glutamyl-tRNA(Asn/Gln) amidotransferase subunit C [Sulfobacillus thermosulfidooxidans DSM 9293]
MSLSEEQVKHVARLARIQLKPEEVSQMTVHLGAVLEYMSQLNELNTDQVQPTMHVIPMTMPLREDIVRPSLPVEEALKNAPDPRDNMFGVPRIMDGGEE